ncbi:hypothetical protein ACHAQH_004695 [Verticillium albo-atrum]
MALLNNLSAATRARHNLPPAPHQARNRRREIITAGVQKTVSLISDKPKASGSLKMTEALPVHPKKGGSGKNFRPPKAVRSLKSARPPTEARLFRKIPPRVFHGSSCHLITPPKSQSRSPSPALSNVNVTTESGALPKPVGFNAKLRLAIGLPTIFNSDTNPAFASISDVEIYLRSLDGFDHEADVSRMFTFQQHHAIERSFAFPMSLIILSHDTREEAVNAARNRMHDYLVDMFRAAVICEAYYPSPTDDGYEEHRHDKVHMDDRMCDFFAQMGSVVNGFHLEDPRWVIGHGPSALDTDTRMALFEGVLYSFRNASNHDAVWTELASAVGKWEEVWWAKLGWF